MIISAHNPKLKFIRALAGRPKERRESRAFLVEGVRLVEDALEAGWSFQFALFSSEISNRGRKLVESLLSKGIEVEETLPELLQSASETETSQGLLAVLNIPNPAITDIDRMDFILIPDQIRDPGNLGTLIRSAAAAGAQAVIIPPETTDPFSPKVVRSGMGAHFRIKILHLGWDEIKSHLAGKNIFLAGASGNLIFWEADFRGPLAMIVGSEANGGSQSAINLANMFVKIPMPGKIESLNAGVAGSILMFEVVRQRSEVG